MNRITLRQQDLPKVIELIGNRGERKYYKLARSKKKLGACLQIIEEQVHKEISQIQS